MKTLKSIICALMASVVVSVMLTGCQDDFDNLTVPVPEASLQRNISIFDLKKRYWNDAVNYIDTIRAEHEGERVVIAGRVVSSDEAGNVFKSLVIDDGTAALAMSINSYNLYLKYRVGQEVVLDVTDMYIGKYNGLQQLGYPEWYANGNAWEATFMAPEFFEMHAQLNGLPQPELVDTLTVGNFSELATDPDGLCYWQSRLVRFNNVYFQNGGVEKFSEYHSSGVNQPLIDSEGASLNVRTSGYSKFWNTVLPKEHGDVVGILSYYGTSGWQLLILDAQGLMNFGHPTEAPGTKGNPATVEYAISCLEQGKNPTLWVEGYIVGAVAPEVTTVTSNSDIDWGTQASMFNTLVIAPTAETREYKQCLIFGLPQDSKLREFGNLVDNPGNLGKKIKLQGKCDTYMGTYGLTGNRGTADLFEIEGVTIPGTEVGDGNGTEASPYSATQVIAGSGAGTTGWMQGYIVGCVNTSNSSNYQYLFTAPFTQASNMLVAASPDVTDLAQCVTVELKSGSDARSTLNLMDHPENHGKIVKLYGSFEQYFRQNGIKSISKFVFEGSSGGTTTPAAEKTYTQASAIVSGKAYGLVASGKMAKPSGATATYGWLYVDDVTVSNNSFKAPEANGFVFTSAGNGNYYISDSYGRLLYMNENYDSFQLSTKLDASNQTFFWNVTAQSDGSFKILNVGKNKFIQFSSEFSSYGAYQAEKGTMPTLYEMEGTPSVLPDLSGSGSGGTTTDPIENLTNVADFNTFNGGAAAASYKTYTNASGWQAENAAIQSGSASGDSNPAFTFIGNSSSILAVCLNGKAGSAGRLVSPVLAGGISKIKFNYGFAFSDTQCQFTVNIKQGEQVVKTWTKKITEIERYKAFTFEEDLSVNGDFVIEIVNDALSAATSNKDRVTVWNLSWNN